MTYDICLPASAAKIEAGPRESSQRTIRTCSVSGFRFLDLPPELRNKVYHLVFAKHDVAINSNRPQKELAALKRSSPDSKFQKPPYRLLGRNIDASPRPSEPSAFSLLKVCRKINQEVVPYFYARTTPHFMTITHVNKFLNIIPKSAKDSITSIGISHRSYGEPYLTRDCKWKDVSDEKWALVCERLHKELPALRSLKLSLTIATWPTQMRVDAQWTRPFMILRGSGLDCMRLRLNHRRFSRHRLMMTARGIEDAMMTAAGVEEREVEDAIEAVREMEYDEACRTPLPEPKTVKCSSLKITNDAATAAQRETKVLPLQKSQQSKPKPMPKRKTKGLEKFHRIDLKTYNISFCNPDGTLMR